MLYIPFSKWDFDGNVLIVVLKCIPWLINLVALLIQYLVNAVSM